MLLFRSTAGRCGKESSDRIVVGGSDGFEHILKVTVLEIGNGKVRLGFDVDAAVPVHRWEVWQRILRSDRGWRIGWLRAHPESHRAGDWEREGQAWLRRRCCCSGPPLGGVAKNPQIGSWLADRMASSTS